MRILVIEDDPTVGQYVKRGLEEQRCSVDLITDGEAGEERAESEAYDLIILDMRLPKKTGLEVLHSLRARGFERPVLVLTAQDAVDAKVTALRAGADDYVTKPFAFEELLARVEALARRPRAIAVPLLTVGDLVLDRAAREVRRAGELIELTPKEFAVLEYLMRHQGRVMSRTLITEYAWGYHFDPGTNIVDVVINHIRKKVDAKHTKKLISTVRGVGYMIKDSEDGVHSRSPLRSPTASSVWGRCLRSPLRSACSGGRPPSRTLPSRLRTSVIGSPKKSLRRTCWERS